MSTFLKSALLIFIYSIIIMAQTKLEEYHQKQSGYEIHISIDEEAKRIHSIEGLNVVEYFQQYDESAPDNPLLPAKLLFLAVIPDSKISVKLREVNTRRLENSVPSQSPILLDAGDSVYYNYNYSDYGYLQKAKTETINAEVVDYTWIRDYYVAVVKVHTHSFDFRKREILEATRMILDVEYIHRPVSNIISETPMGNYDLELSQIILNYGYAREYRSNHKYNTVDYSDWIDYSKVHFKVPVIVDGIYRIFGYELQNAGFQISQLVPEKLAVFHKGSEVPILLEGVSDGKFDENDYIEFYAEKNYGSTDYRFIVPKGSDYKNYYDIYTDTSYYWVTERNDSGIRTPLLNSQFLMTADTIKTHLAKIHLEKDVRLWYYDAVAASTQLPQWQEHKVWTWSFFGKGGAFSTGISIKDIVPESNFQATARMISNAADVYPNAHLIGLSINNSQILDSVQFDYRQTVNLSVEQSASLLSHGNNSIKLTGLPTNASFYQVMVDWVDIDYIRYNRMQDDSLLIEIPGSVTGNVSNIEVSNVTSDSILVYKLFPQLVKITGFSTNNNRLIFSDSVAPGNKYLIIGTSKIRRNNKVTLTQFKNLRSPQLGADYIIITNRALSSVETVYEPFIASNYNVRTKTVYIDDIYNEFGFGYPKPESIKTFMKYAYDKWVAPHPSYVCIIGDATYDYKQLTTPAPPTPKTNFVPSYGNPVSDSWFVMFNENLINIPQMYIGRIPVTSNDELLHYMMKHQTSFNRKMDQWNKTALFFSGGDIGNSGELQQIFNANADVFNSYHTVFPLFGRGEHFYKTQNPVTNFGPFPSDYVTNSIQEGSVYISYVGHSGTQTWDNGINTIDYLKSKYSDRHPLITDFGCSTGKFAEPDIDAFGELFIRESGGQAIGYISNSSWGYLSTSLRIPKYFFGSILRDSIRTIGVAHHIAKVKNLQESGVNDVNRVFMYCNLLFGDPIAHIAIPVRPNFYINQSDIRIIESNPSEFYDSLSVAHVIHNYGTGFTDSVEIGYDFLSKGVLESSRIVKFRPSNNSDTIIVKVPAKGKTGKNSIKITIDPSNRIEESTETDNSVLFEYDVYPINLRSVIQDRVFSHLSSEIVLVNPMTITSDNTSSLLSQFDRDVLFPTPIQLSQTFDSVVTRISLSQFNNAHRYWFRYKVNEPGFEWSEPISFTKSSRNLPWRIDAVDSMAFSSLKSNVDYDSIMSKWTLSNQNNTLEVISAGGYEGAFGSILYNGEEFLPNTFYWGVAAAVLDSLTLKPVQIRYFVYPYSVAGPAIVNFIDSLPTGTLVAFTASADAVEPTFGFSQGTAARRALENMGSLYADSVKYRESWSMIGKKGAPKGSVPEQRTLIFTGLARVRDEIQLPADSGYIAFPKIGPASRWGEMALERQVPAGAKLITDVYGIKNDGSEALLLKHTSADTALSLTSINPTQYPFIRLQPNFYANNLKQSPTLAVAAVDFDGLPELAINYQVMSLSRDSVMQGETVDVLFDVYNVGFSVANQFQVVLEGVDPNNARTTLATYQVDTLGKDSKKRFALTYTAVGQQNKMTFVVTIDPQNAVSELYEDNNSFSRELKITQDTSRPSVFVTFDDVDILDGDFVSSKPTIDVVYNDPSALTAADTGLVQIFLNNTRIYHNDPSITSSFNLTNPKIKVQYKPELADGKYQLKVQYTNPSGSYTDTSGVKKIFTVESQSSLTYVYNYPNPMKDETYFTFKLTTIPKEFFIKIYTIAGRLIREISVPITDLKHDFNRIFWDGKDQDGDAIANGVYFARFIMKADDKNEIVTQKIAVVK